MEPYPKIDNLEMAKYFKDNSYDYLINKESIRYIRMSYLMKLLARAFSQIFKCIFEVYFKNFCPSLFELF